MMVIPWLDKILYKNKWADMVRRTPGNKILGFVGQTIRERQKQVSEGVASEKPDGKKDFLARYIEIQRNGSEIPPW